MIGIIHIFIDMSKIKYPNIKYHLILENIFLLWLKLFYILTTVRYCSETVLLTDINEQKRNLETRERPFTKIRTFYYK